MPDAAALATKIGRPLLGLLPEALKSFKRSYSVLFSSVPVAGASRELSALYRTNFSMLRIFPCEKRTSFTILRRIITANKLIIIGITVARVSFSFDESYKRRVEHTM